MVVATVVVMVVVLVVKAMVWVGVVGVAVA
jgi:hypothetical protein